MEILLELSLSNLKNNTTRDFGNGRNERASKIIIKDLEYIPSLSEKTLLIKATVTSADSQNKTNIKFSNVVFSSEPQPNFVQIVTVDGTELYIKRMTHSQATAQVRCTCLDFYYRFSVWNHARKSLEGDPPQPYIKKTDSMPVNPNRVPGMCKHINKLAQHLRAEGIIR